MIVRHTLGWFDTYATVSSETSSMVVCVNALFVFCLLVFFCVFWANESDHRSVIVSVSFINNLLRLIRYILRITVLRIEERILCLNDICSI